MSDEAQCQTCGHITRDWSNEGMRRDEEGLKADQLPGSQDRIAAYRQWRRHLGVPSVSDFDQVEWRFDEERRPYPVALFEVTRVDGDRRVPDSYLKAIYERIWKRDWQGRLAVEGARRLGCKAWVVAFRHDLTEFWVYNLTDDRGWWALKEADYRLWLEHLENE